MESTQDFATAPLKPQKTKKSPEHRPGGVAAFGEAKLNRKYRNR